MGLYESVKKKLIGSFAKSWLRGSLRAVGGALVGYGLADADAAGQLTGSLEQIALNLLDNPEVLYGLGSAIAGQLLSLRNARKTDG